MRCAKELALTKIDILSIEYYFENFKRERKIRDFEMS